MPAKSIKNIYQRTESRGFHLDTAPLLTIAYIADAPRSGRPKIAIIEGNADKLVELVNGDRYARVKTIAELSTDLDISLMLTQRLIKLEGFNYTKHTRRPGLTNI